MKEFDPHPILLQCCPLPLPEDSLKEFEGRTCYRMVMPQMYCCWDRGFYFQPAILDFDFNQYFPSHSSKTNFILNRWKPKECKKVPNLDGIFSECPVLAFYICVNRNLFQPLGVHHNKIEWLKSLTQRTEGIAHELLYADQYAKYFDPTAGKTSRPIVLPNPDQEEDLLCPTHQIQTSFDSFKEEKKFFQDEAEFLAHQATEVIQKYYHFWLEHYGVSEGICYRRTLAYLRMRPHHKLVENSLKTCMAKHGISDIDSLKFKRHVYDETAFVQDFFVEVTKNGCNYPKLEVVSHTVLLINRSNGHELPPKGWTGAEVLWV